ncbi:hypothetical protein ACHWQZ_G001295 [Mnemiopsis leidyi]
MARLFLLLTATLCVVAGSVQEEAKLRIYYGEDADKNEFPFTASVNVKEEGAELVKRMKFKKKDVFNMHVDRLRPRDKLKHSVNSRFFATKVEMGNCRMDREAALQIVNEWARKRNEIN